jgi:ADP-heptose:LPS heptosyltransferase
MGDVALVAPVIRAMRTAYPDAEITFLTKKLFVPFFPSGDPGLRFFTPDFRGRHAGFSGIFRLYHDLRKSGRFDHLIDLHDVLRSKILRILFLSSGTSVSVISKGRREKRRLIKGRSRRQLKHTVERYSNLFRSAGYLVKPLHEPSLVAEETIPEWVLAGSGTGEIKIGIAPFAKHILKRWPEDYLKLLLKKIGSDRKVRFFIFAGAEEREQAEKFAAEAGNALNICGKLTLSQEVALMQKLDLMIAMDSSNMHMAALAGARVISIWGATDPLAGFGAWTQPDEYSIRIPVSELPCRPCTVYGKGKCRRGDFACMMWLKPETVYERMKKLEVFNLKI